MFNEPNFAFELSRHATGLWSKNEPDSDLPTTPDPGKNNPEGGPHLPTMPDPVRDPENGYRLPTDPDPVDKPREIRDPLTDSDQAIERIA